VESRSLVRLSVKKAAYADLSRAKSRKSGEAPDNLDAGHRTQVWLAVSEDPGATVTGKYFYHKLQRPPNPTAHDARLQDALLDACKRLSGVEMPAN
jgi:hypothetical protein